MSLLTRDSTLDDVLHPVTRGAPRCRGNCKSGRRDCTLPGVCTLGARVRMQRRAAPPPETPQADDPLDTPGDAAWTRGVIVVYVALAAIVASVLWP